MTDDNCAQTPMRDRIEGAIAMMERGAFMRLGNIPGDASMMSASYDGQVSQALAARLAEVEQKCREFADVALKNGQGLLTWEFRAKAAEAALADAHNKALRDASEVCQNLAAQVMDAVLTGLPEQARQRESMEAAFTKAQHVILALQAPQEAPAEPAAWGDVLAERKRQVKKEGWTPEHDDQHDMGQLARAAATYAWCASVGTVDRGDAVPTTWPWDREWWKPTDRRRDLVKAGALILAEIERLDRATEPQEAPAEPDDDDWTYQNADEDFPEYAARPDLSDPNTVHINMLRGTIAKPTLAQIVHLYGVDELCRALAPEIVRKANATQAPADPVKTTPASLDTWQSWIDDLPLDEGFREGQEDLQEYLWYLASLTPSPSTVTVPRDLLMQVLDEAESMMGEAAYAVCEEDSMEYAAERARIAQLRAQVEGK
jgi:hypothetical protein